MLRYMYLARFVQLTNMTVVLDTDPGVDDMLALLLLLTADIDFRMITLTFGNCSLLAALKNVLSLFRVVQRENQFRKSQGLKAFSEQKPFIYLGSTEALSGPGGSAVDLDTLHSLHVANIVDATDVHGKDGLAGIHAAHPEFDAPNEWLQYFGINAKSPDSATDLPFRPGGAKPAWQAIVELLREEPANTVTLIAIGPLTNIAKAAQLDPVAFSRVKQVLSMGGSLRVPGNVTPLAEFNVYADPYAAAQVYSLTSLNPAAVLPPNSPASMLTPLPKPLQLVIFPLDITQQHNLHKPDVEKVIGALIAEFPESVLCRWIYKWLTAAFANYGRLVGLGPENATCHLHDPLTAAYILGLGQWVEAVEDVRVETSGQWCLGNTVVDNRGRAKSEYNPHDLQKWLTLDEGNNVTVAVTSPVTDNFHKILLNRITNL